MNNNSAMDLYDSNWSALSERIPEGSLSHTVNRYMAKLLAELPEGKESPAAPQDSIAPADSLTDAEYEPLDAVEPQLAKALREAFGVEHKALLRAGQSISHYVVLGRLGSGGMGTVFKAYDTELDRAVAIKLLHAEVDKEAEVRLKREAQALARLSHPNVVQVHEVGETEGQTFIVMELVKGQTLRDWMEEKPRDWHECVRVYLQAGEGLAAAHDAGLVHRDFKPDNAIIDKKGHVRVLDFGLARRANGVEAEQKHDRPAILEAQRAVLDVSLTHTGTMLGTPGYMPPEQWKGKEADARSDQFSFCVSLYESLYGDRPFAGKTMHELMISVLEGRMQPTPKSPLTPSRLREVLHRGLAVEAEQRWLSMEILLGELRRTVSPRSRRWIGLGLALGSVALGGGLWLGGDRYAEWTNRCAGATEQLVGVWDDSRREEIKDAILSTELVYAPDTWESIEARLDEYTEAWVNKHIGVCRATSVWGEQSADVMEHRMACLRDRRATLQATVGVLSLADEQVVENAIKLVVGLPGLRLCDDIERLQEMHQRMPPPEDPQVAQEVDALRNWLKRIKAEETSGKHPRAIDQLNSKLDRALDLGYAPLLAEIKLVRGRLKGKIAHSESAEQDLAEAYTIATEQGHDEVAFIAARSLAFEVGYQQARYAEGLIWGQSALPLANRLGESTKVAATMDTLGLVLIREGEYGEAERQFQQAIKLNESVLGEEHPNVVVSVNNLGLALNGQGEYSEAERYYRRALHVREKVFGVDHPEVAKSVSSLGNVLLRQGEYGKAERHHRRALRIQKQAHGENHPGVAASLNNLGDVFEAQGKFAEAEQEHRRALLVREQVLRRDHPAIAETMNSLGIVCFRQGKYEEAERQFRKSLKIKERSLGLEHPSVAYTVNSLGNILEKNNQLGDAESQYRRALKIWEHTIGLNHPDAATSMSNLGVVLERQGRHIEAEQQFRQALQVRESTLDANNPRLVYPLLGLIKTSMVQRDFDAARKHAERAVSIREASKVAPDLLAEARFLLARSLWPNRAQRSWARELAEQARNAFAEHGPGREDDLAEVEEWLRKHRRGG